MVDVQSAPVEGMTDPVPPALPDYVLSPNAVFNDEGVQWRYGRAPDYSKTRKVWEEGEYIHSNIIGLQRTTSARAGSYSSIKHRDTALLHVSVSAAAEHSLSTPC